jgi:hypothetical protein
VGCGHGEGRRAVVAIGAHGRERRFLVLVGTPMLRYAQLRIGSRRYPDPREVAALQ